MAEGFTCGFARVALKTTKEKVLEHCKRQQNESTTKYKLRYLDNHREAFRTQFPNAAFDIPPKTFNEKVPKIWRHSKHGARGNLKIGNYT